MIYLFLGSDEYLTAQQITKLKASLGDPTMVDLNTTEVAGNQTTASDLLGQANMMPFLASRRLLLANGYLDRLDKRMAVSKRADSAAHLEAVQLLEGLSSVPDSCDLIFIDSDLDKRRQLWKGFSLPKSDKGPKRQVKGLDALIKAKQIAHESQATPDAKALPGWIQQRVRHKKIQIDNRSIQMLANFVGPNLRLLDNELDKLATYASGRSITADDIKLLVSDASEALIWDLTDALSQRNGRKAMGSLYELRRSDANPFYLLTMIARQYRITLQVKEALSLGGGNEYDIAKQIGQRPYPVKKAMAQSRQYTLTELDEVMDKLLEADYRMKMGANPETTIDVLVAELTLKR